MSPRSDAEQLLETLFARDPTAIAIGQRLATHYARSDRPARAASVLIRAATACACHGAHPHAVRLAMDAISLDPCGASEAEVRAWVSAVGETQAVRLAGWVGAHAASALPDIARDLLRTATWLDPADAEPWLELASIEAGLRNQAAATRALVRYAKVAAQSAEGALAQEVRDNLALALCWWPCDADWRAHVNALCCAAGCSPSITAA